MNWASRHLKKAARAFQLQAAPSARLGIFLPGWDIEDNDGCLCVEEAIKNGLIGRDTRIIAVEREAALIPLIDGKLRDLGLEGRYRLHHGELSNLVLAEDDLVDFAFFDFLGCMDELTAVWMTEHFRNHLAPGATLSFTFSYGERNNEFFKRCDKTFRQSFQEQARWAAQHFGIDNESVLLNVLILISCLPGWSFTHRRPLFYRDNVRSMIAYRFDNLMPVEAFTWPSVYKLAGTLLKPKPQQHHAAPGLGKSKTTTGTPASISRVGELLRLLGKVPQILEDWPEQQRDSVAAKAEALKAMIEEGPRVVPQPRQKPVSTSTQRAKNAWATRRANGWVHPRRRPEERPARAHP